MMTNYLLKKNKLTTHILLLLLFLFSINLVSAQKRDEAVIFMQKDRIDRFHTIDDLSNLKKGQLIELYNQRINEIFTVLPFISLTNEPSVKLGDIGIKEDSNHIKILGKHVEASQESLEVTKGAIEELIPYADTEKIIGAILFFEDVIKKSRIGLQSGY